MATIYECDICSESDGIVGKCHLAELDMCEECHASFHRKTDAAMDRISDEFNAVVASAVAHLKEAAENTKSATVSTLKGVPH